MKVKRSDVAGASKRPSPPAASAGASAGVSSGHALDHAGADSATIMPQPTRAAPVVEANDFAANFFNDPQVMSMMFEQGLVPSYEDMSYTGAQYNFLLDDDDDDDDFLDFSLAGPASMPVMFNSMPAAAPPSATAAKSRGQSTGTHNASGTGTSSSLPFIPSVQSEQTVLTSGVHGAAGSQSMMPDAKLRLQNEQQQQQQSLHTQQFVFDPNFPAVDGTVTVVDDSSLNAVTSPMDTSADTPSENTQQLPLVMYDVMSPSPKVNSDVSNASSASLAAPEVFANSAAKTRMTTTKSRRSKTSTSSAATSRRRVRKASVSSSSRDVSPVTVTPVAVISDIVADKIQDDDLYKEVATKPIKHQVEINVDSAHNRSVKNAINARVNRQKHKQFVATLEDENAGLRRRIDTLEADAATLRTEKDLLQQEIRYLKSVIANETTIGRVLDGLSSTVKDVRLTSGFQRRHQQRKRAATDDSADRGDADSTEHKRASRMRTDADDDVSPLSSSSSPPAAGVCLHVHSDSVSVEFCDHCAKMASASDVVPTQ